jgi:uncharacterized protein YuzE
MTVTIGNLSFDHSMYDARGDVLYLHRGATQAATDSEGTPEGHVVRFGAGGEVIGITLVTAKRILERDGKIDITVPQHLEPAASSVTSALVAA